MTHELTRADCDFFQLDSTSKETRSIRGQVCQELACPSCHLRVPRPLFESAPLFASIAGTPSCGKTYFLASMTWRLRHTLPKHFAMTFSDADPVSNLLLNEYENQQFFSSSPDELVKLAKTQEHGDLYDTVMYGEQLVEYPRPFLFSIRPSANHPNYAKSARVSRLLCLYDNAGESFEPGKDDVSAPVTRHLAQSQVVMFCFDPTQDPRLRKECQARTTDPQVVTALRNTTTGGCLSRASGSRTSARWSSPESKTFAASHCCCHQA